MNALQAKISHEIDVSKQLDYDFNFLKILVMSQWIKQSHRYGDLQQPPAHRNEQLHTTHLKYHWNTSNHNLNYLPQLSTDQCRIFSFEASELNLQASAQCRTYSSASSNDLPSGADFASPLPSQSYVNHKFMGPQIYPDGKHPDTMIRDFRAILHTTEETKHRMVIISDAQEFTKQKRHKKTYTSDEQPHTM